MHAPTWLPVATFRVDGIPKGQPRPRACIRGARAGIYDPGTADAWRTAIVFAARRHAPAEPLAEAVAITVTFRFPTPKSRRHESPSSWFRGKPDIDNALKVVMDALTDAAYWTDDALVVDVAARKQETVPGETPGAIIEILREEA
jgi:crossover junction endodeoxyribonuclease RusA